MLFSYCLSFPSVMCCNISCAKLLFILIVQQEKQELKERLEVSERKLQIATPQENEGVKIEQLELQEKYVAELGVIIFLGQGMYMPGKRGG